MKEFGSTVERHRHDRTFPVSSGVSTSRARPPAWQSTKPSALTGQSVTLVRRAWNISPALGTSLEQKPRFRGCFSVPSRSKGNRIISIYGAGDGNRTHVRNLGSCRHLASETIPKRQNQGGGFGALQAPGTDKRIELHKDWTSARINFNLLGSLRSLLGVSAGRIYMKFSALQCRSPSRLSGTVWN